MLGEKFGDYEIVRLVGRGGMGAVFEAINANINRRAAIKVLHPEFTKDDDAVRRFFNEARAVNTINHPGVVQVSDVGKRADGSLYLVMEFLEGQTLTERLQERGGKLPENETVTISWQLSGVLAAAHTKEIIHRDLKPGNIMLVPDMAGPEGERVKLLDFGIAKLGGDRGEDSQTSKGQVLGTATYMAPEQFQSDEVVDGQSDVYCLAIVMYRMVSGRVPFVSTVGEVGLAAMHMFQQHQSLKDVAPQTPSWLSDLIDAMLRKDRTKRPTMGEVLDELQQHLNFRPAARRLSGSLVRLSASELELVMDDVEAAVGDGGPSKSQPVSAPGTFSSASVQLARLEQWWGPRRHFLAAAGGVGVVLLIGIWLIVSRGPKPVAVVGANVAGETVAVPSSSAPPTGAAPNAAPANPAGSPGPVSPTLDVKTAGNGGSDKRAAANPAGPRANSKKDAKSRGPRKRSTKIIN